MTSCQDWVWAKTSLGGLLFLVLFGAPSCHGSHCPTLNMWEFDTSNRDCPRCLVSNVILCPNWNVYISGKAKKPYCGLQMPWWKEAPCHQYFELSFCLASWRWLMAQRHALLLPRGQSNWNGMWGPPQVSPQDGCPKTEFSQRWISWRLTVVLETLWGLPVSGAVCTCLESHLCAPFAFYHS